MKKTQARLRAGEFVEVLSKDEILQTLDANGQMDGFPFMPEMFRYCGQRFRVYKRAHKTCDTIHGSGGRRMANAVHLEGLRCDGEAHGGCQAGCLIFWKEAWLRRVSDRSTGSDLCRLNPESHTKAGTAPCSEPDVWKASQRGGQENPTYVCQATKLFEATGPLPWYDLRQYVEDYKSGNATPAQVLLAILFMAYQSLIDAGVGLGPILRWAYERGRHLWGGNPYPRKRGRVPRGVPTPDIDLGLQPGEWVKVKNHEEILDTLDHANKNRGLYFDAEEVPYCGGKYKVLRRVNRIINEKTGQMMVFKKESVLLEGVVCQARYSAGRFLCPRAIYPMWREAWLERLQEPGPASEEERPKGFAAGGNNAAS